jgi:RRXRR protein
MQRKVKSDTSLDKIQGCEALGRSKSCERSVRGSTEDMRGTSQAPIPSERRKRWECKHRYRTGLSLNPVVVPVLALDGEPLMPTCASRARRWIKEQKATPFWLNGVWCVRLRFEPNGKAKQEVVVGIDPGRKREAYTVASKAHTYLNVISI